MDGTGHVVTLDDAARRSGATHSGITFSGFSNGRLLWMCRGLDCITQVAIDGGLLARDVWDFDERAAILSIAPDPVIYDALDHRVEVSGLRSGKPAKLVIRYASSYRYALDGARSGCLRGWIVDTVCPSREVPLVAAVAGRRDRAFIANTERPDLAGHAARGGFEYRWRESLLERGPSTIEIRVAGTAFCPFGQIRVPPAGPGATETEIVTVAPGPYYNNVGPVRVAVIIPVFLGLAETLACLAAVRESRDRISRDVIVIDDASPDGRLSRAVLDFAYEAGFQYVRNDENRGFAACANAGMALRPDHDIVLLNADTEVPSGWLDRLYRAAMTDPAVATVTPLSNNATIMSLPEIGGSTDLPYDLSLAQIDQLCREVNEGQICDVPTAHGFCVYIRRAALNQVGGFDAANFGRGYGEENDFSIRAVRLGWRNVVAADVFVRHVGAVSFGDEREALVARNMRLLNERFPGYDDAIGVFMQEDPLRHLRSRPQIALWRRIGAPVVIVTHALPGGTLRHVEQLTADLQKRGQFVLWLRRETAAEPGADPVLGLSQPGTPCRVLYRGARAADEALADVFALAPRFIHVHHLIDLPATVASFLRLAGIPYVVTAHDYFFGCPRVTLLDEGGTFCDVPDVAHCTPCLAAGKAHESLHKSHAADARSGVAWRARWAPFLTGAHQIIVPSHSAGHYLEKLFPGIVATVRPHALPAEFASAEIMPGDPGRIAVIGAIGPHKGAAALHELVRHCSRSEPDLRFVLIGHSDRDAALSRYGNVELAGVYEPADAVSAIALSGCATALFLSIWPETYCYTLSEAMLAGLVPVAFDIGAVGERLRACGAGVLIPPHSRPDAIVAAVRAAARLPRPERDALAGPRYDDLFSDYYAALPEPAENRVTTLLGEASGVTDDLWCERHFAITILTRAPARELELAFWCHPAHLAQNCRLEIPGGPACSVWLQPGAVSSISVPVADRHATLHMVKGMFDFATALEYPDRRHAAAKLVGVSVSGANGERRRYRVAGPESSASPALSLVPV